MPPSKGPRTKLGYDNLPPFVEKMASKASVKFPKTLGEHISLYIGEREEEKEENQVLYASVTFS